MSGSAVNIESIFTNLLQGNSNGNSVSFSNGVSNTVPFLILARLTLESSVNAEKVGGSVPTGLPVRSEADAYSDLEKIADNRVSSIEFENSIKNRAQKTTDFINEINKSILLERIPEDRSLITRCERCFGQGENSCSRCAGSGEVFCSSCFGGGKKTETTYIKDRNGNIIQTKIHKVNCLSCGGSGKNSCNYCNGRGKISCDFCTGTGKQTLNYSLDLYLSCSVSVDVSAEALHWHKPLILAGYNRLISRNGLEILPEYFRTGGHGYDVGYRCKTEVEYIKILVENSSFDCFLLGRPPSIEMTPYILDHIHKSMLEAVKNLKPGQGEELYDIISKTHVGMAALEAASSGEKSFPISKFKPLLSREMADKLVFSARSTYKTVGRRMRRFMWITFIILAPFLALAALFLGLQIDLPRILDIKIRSLWMQLLLFIPFLVVWFGVLLLLISHQQRRCRKYFGTSFNHSIVIGAAPWVALVLGGGIYGFVVGFLTGFL